MKYSALSVLIIQLSLSLVLLSLLYHFLFFLSTDTALFIRLPSQSSLFVSFCPSLLLMQGVAQIGHSFHNKGGENREGQIGKEGEDKEAFTWLRCFILEVKYLLRER